VDKRKAIHKRDWKGEEKPERTRKVVPRRL
jgi:hypothetical protein